MIKFGLIIILISFVIALIYGAMAFYYFGKAEYLKQNREFKEFKKFAKTIDKELSELLNDDDLTLHKEK